MTTPPKYEDLVLKVAEMERREAALLEEASCLKAVLNGMEFKQVDDMVSDGVDACLFLGQESARIIKGIQAERAALREELEVANNACSILNDLTKTISTEKHALQQRLTVAEKQVKHWIGVSSEATCWAASINEQVGEQSGVLLNLIMSNIDLDEHGFFSLSGIRPDNFWSAVEAAGARIDLEASVSATRITAAAKYPSLVEAFPDSPGGYYNGCPSSALSDPMQCWRDGYEKAKKRAIDAGFKVKP